MGLFIFRKSTFVLPVKMRNKHMMTLREKR